MLEKRHTMWLGPGRPGCRSPLHTVLEAWPELLFSWQVGSSGTLFKDRINAENISKLVWNKISTEGV